MNANGWIVGDAINSSGVTHAYLLIPVPEPSTAVLFAVGGLALGAASVPNRCANRKYRHRT